MAGSGSSETVTCESSQFSTYMLAYSESDEDAAYDDGDKSDKSDSNTAKSSSTKKVKTGDENKPLIWGGLLAAAALALIIFFILRRKNNDDEE